MGAIVFIIHLVDLLNKPLLLLFLLLLLKYFLQRGFLQNWGSLGRPVLSRDPFRPMACEP